MRWAARLFAKAFPVSPVRAVKRRTPLNIQTLELRENPTVSGLVFVDLDQNGAQDPGEVGVPGVVVTATLSDNTTETATTDSGGGYSLLTNDPAVRLQFSAIPEGLIVGKSTPTTGSTVRFVDASADPTNVDLGLNSYLVVLNTYFYDKATTGVAAGEGAIITVEYAADGVQTPSVLATNDQVGATFGLAYHSQSNSVYASSFLKRHAGLGPNTLDPTAPSVGTTTGGVYRVDRANANTVSILVDMNNLPAAVIPSGSTAANFATGADPHPTDADIDGGDWLHDAATVPLVGKRGLGGLAASADGRTLYTINLATRELIEIPVNVDGTLDTTRDLRRTAVPLTNPGGITSFNAADLRPFAVTVRGNAVFVGVTYTAQTQGGTAARANLRAIVYAFDPATGTFRSYNGSTSAFAAGANAVISAPLNYARGYIDQGDPTDTTDDAAGTWNAWTDTFTNQVATTGSIFTKPMPWLTDIAFDGANMVLGLRDRFGDMGGYQTYTTDTNATDPIDTVAGGDVLRASLITTGASTGSWLLESNGASGGVTTGGAGNTQGPGGGEYYYQDNFTDVTNEVMTGGLAQVPGYRTIISTGIDVQDAASGGVFTLLHSDTDPDVAVNTAGTTFARGQTYLTSDFSTFGSANGVGNAEILASDSSIQVGDRVFADTNSNGIQDPGELGIPGVALDLFRAGTQVSSATTDASGNFLFENLDPVTAYEIRLSTTQTALAGRTITQATQGTNTAIDSNGTVVGTTATIAFTTGSAGTSDHTLDVGFTGSVTGTVTLGNQVFVDANNNGLLDSGESGLAGITVQLINSGGTVAASTTTGANGIYTFAGLAAGEYRVRIAASNFNTGEILAGYTSSTGTNGAFETNSPPDPDLDANNDDNGITDTTAGALGAGGFIQSGPVTLALNGEPTNDGDTNNNTNLALDFGIVAPAAAGPLTLGNQVFVDANNSGTLDGAEAGISGVTVQLINSGGTVAATTTTGANGIYSFPGLAAGTYRVRIAAANFNTGAVLAGYTSSTGTGGAFETTNPPDPNLDVNNDDNGITDTTAGALGAGGFIQSGPITLAANGEPTDDGDTDNNTNLTLDFGVVAPVAGTLTLGNQVFVDTNNNGLLDNGESGIQGVTVQLINSGGTVAASTTTAANGIYTFTGLAAGNYRVRIAAANFNTGQVLAGYTSSTGTNGAFETTSPPDPNLDVNNDDNGITDTTAGALGAGGFIQSGPVTLVAGGEPTNDGDTDANTNLSLDFGVVAPAAGPLTLGNQVFTDANNNGLLDNGETGIQGVTVQLVNGSGNIIATTVTGANGVYTFPGLAAGGYFVRIAPSNFSAGNVLEGYTSSTGTGGAFETNNPPVPDLNADNDDNGITDTTGGALGAGGFIQSGIINLTVNGEPVNDGDTNNNTNLTLDFGMVAPTAAGSLSLGNTVFNDANDNGTLDTGESGIAGVTVQLISSTGTVLQSATTVAGGQYTFTGLAAGDYRVRIAASNFNSGGVLVGFTSSVGLTGEFETNSPPDPDNNIDGDDNGITDITGGALGAGGFIQSSPISLAVGAEPTNDGDSSANTNLTLDFGVRQQAAANTLTLGNQVFVDANNNGLLDNGENGLQGVTVQLINSAGTVAASTVTLANGTYSFANLAAGTYRVRIAAANFNTGAVLAGYTSSTGTGGAFETTNPPDPNGNVNNDDNGVTDTTAGALGAGGFIQSGPIALALGAEPTNDGDTDANTNLTLDFGVVAPGSGGTLSLGNTVFNDLNNNGTLDSGESGIAGVTVQLISSAGAVLQSATTDSSGQYTFTNLAAGSYKVRVAAANFNTTGTAGVLAGFTSSTGTNGSLTGTFETTTPVDPNNNTDGDDNGVIISTGGALGAGGFVESGTITLAVGTEPVNDGDTSADTNLTLDFGMFRKFSVGNQVYNDLNNNGVRDTNETGIGNVTVRLLSTATGNPQVATTTTNGSGQYLFTNLIAGDYIVEVAATNFNTGNPLFSFQSSTGGTGTPFEGTATPDPDTTATDGDDNGTTITTGGVLGSGGVIRSAAVTLGPTANEPTAENPANDTTTPDAQSNLTVDFGVFQQTPATSSIAGRVFLDYDNSGTFNGPDTGISGVTLTLTGGTLATPLTVTTDSSGNYSFTNLAAGTYTVTETQPTTPANQTGKTTAGTANGNATATVNAISNIVLGANVQATGYTFAEVPLVSTGGAVYEDANGNGLKDSGELGVAGVTITLTGTNVVNGAITPITATTDSSGNYTFTNILPGTYTIAETQPTGYTDGQEQNGTPAASSVQADRFVGINLSTTAAASGGFNFGEVKTGSLAGVVFEDENNNGTQDTGEAGIAGVTIRLTGTSNGASVNRTATTGTDGTYSFTNVGPGTYAVTETQPAKYVDGTATAGTSGGTAGTNTITGITLASGAAATGYNFGEKVSPDLSVTQTQSPSRPRPGSTVTLTYTVRNVGSGAATNAKVDINLGGLTFVSSSDTTAFDPTTMDWTVGDLDAGATETLTITARVPSSGKYRPSSSVSSDTTEVVTSNNSATGLISAGLGITLQDFLSSSYKKR